MNEKMRRMDRSLALSTNYHRAKKLMGSLLPWKRAPLFCLHSLIVFACALPLLMITEQYLVDIRFSEWAEE